MQLLFGILKSIGEIKDVNLSDTLFLGELSLNGKVKKINGILPLCLEAAKAKIKRIIVPIDNSREVNINGIFKIDNSPDFDLSEVKGQESIKRALEIAAAGRT